ncbi:YcxB family protein [Nonomuraea sp. 10N515B]|uniref:YcxB family protein n=1 Tax=Nonomuraea sp. 10N515B TaxID=3457422 RepID=UPI003FCE7ABB
MKACAVDFTVRYQPSPEEVARALQQGVKLQFRALLTILLSVLAGCGLLCVLIGSVTIGIAMFVGAAVSPLVVSWSLRRRRRLAFLCVPTTLHLTGDGYKVETEQSTATTRWSLFGPVVTTPEFWLFFVNRQFTGFLPRRAFTDEQQAALDAFFAARQDTPVS